MVRAVLIISMLASIQFIHAQDSETKPAYEIENKFPGYKGILSAQATFATGYNLNFSSINYLLHGDLEYYLDDRISVRSDIYYFLNSKTKSDIINAVEPFNFQHNLFVGAEYHFLKSKFDWYAGIQPGMVYGQRQYQQIQEINGTPSPLEEPQKTFSAIFSVNTGINYYASKFFLLFLQVRYNTGWFSDNYSVASLNEIRGSFGLGFYIRAWKRKIRNA